MSEAQESARQAPIGVMGLAVMGRNLALNIADHGFPVAVWNRTQSKTDALLAENPGKPLIGTSSLEGLVKSLERPRRVILMIQAGEAVDQNIEALRPLLDSGDIIIDGGNSWFQDTRRREAELRRAGLRFIGTGISGGEEGARFGPAIMPGGDREAYERIRPIVEAIAAKTDSGPCVTYVGPDGAGHFVKMVHNGIEYGDMQIIAEAYDLLKRVAGLEAGELARVFSKWNKGPLESFLIELTGEVFKVEDAETGRPLVDMVLDKAGQKGTGIWTVRIALELGVPVPTIAAAVDARVLSSMKDERVAASKEIKGPEAKPATRGKKKLLQAIHDAIYASKICSYAQGMRLIQAASAKYNWNVNMKETARIWKGGCIIRARFLDDIMRAYERRPDLPSLLLDSEFKAWLEAAQSSWRDTISMAQRQGIPVQAMSASLAYFDSYRTAQLPQNLTQAQRDAFGAHTYQRADAPERGFLHSQWLPLKKKRVQK